MRLKTVHSMPARRSATSAARAVPPAPMTAAVRAFVFADQRCETVDVGVVGDDAPSDANERIDRARFARVAANVRAGRLRERERVFLERRGDRKPFRREALAARERRGDVEKIIRLENRIRGGDAALAKDGVVNGRRAAVRRGIADDGEDLVRAQRVAIRSVDRQRLLQRQLPRRRRARFIDADELQLRSEERREDA